MKVKNNKKRFLVFAVCFFVFSASVFAQGIDRSQYRSIDPFDYRLNEFDAARGAVRRFRSVVRFLSESSVGRNRIFSFVSLDNNTTLEINGSAQISAPSPGQVLTIYFTATKRVNDTRVLDEMDLANTTESGIDLVRSTVTTPSSINRAEHREIDPFDYINNLLFIEEGEVRKYRSALQFSSQEGIMFFFSSTDPMQTTRLRMRATRRFPVLTEGQRVSVYYTAERGFLDILTLDYIEL